MILSFCALWTSRKKYPVPLLFLEKCCSISWQKVLSSANLIVITCEQVKVLSKWVTSREELPYPGKYSLKGPEQATWPRLVEAKYSFREMLFFGGHRQKPNAEFLQERE